LRAPVVYVHGLWMPGEESLILRHRLAHGFELALHGASAELASNAQVQAAYLGM